MNTINQPDLFTIYRPILTKTIAHETFAKT